jgi:hypothetical protein
MAGWMADQLDVARAAAWAVPKETQLADWRVEKMADHWAGSTADSMADKTAG